MKNSQKLLRVPNCILSKNSFLNGLVKMGKSIENLYKVQGMVSTLQEIYLPLIFWSRGFQWPIGVAEIISKNILQLVQKMQKKKRNVQNSGPVFKGIHLHANWFEKRAAEFKIYAQYFKDFVQSARDDFNLAGDFFSTLNIQWR